jgi:hypothetical protein
VLDLPKRKKSVLAAVPGLQYIAFGCMKLADAM